MRRLLVGEGAPREITDGWELALRYTYPDPVPGAAFVRADMVATVDGAAHGPDGRSRSVSSEADRPAFAAMRALADVILVGRGTAEAERYEDVDLPDHPQGVIELRERLGQSQDPAIALVTGSGQVPERLMTGPGFVSAENRWRLVVLTCAAAPAERLADLRARLGEDAVVVSDGDHVDLVGAVAALVARGLPRILCEGGPSLLARAAAAGVLDELCMTTTPLLEGGSAARSLTGQDDVLHLPLELTQLIEHDGTLLARWAVRRP